MRTFCQKQRKKKDLINSDVLQKDAENTLDGTRKQQGSITETKKMTFIFGIRELKFWDIISKERIGEFDTLWTC